MLFSSSDSPSFPFTFPKKFSLLREDPQAGQTEQLLRVRRRRRNSKGGMRFAFPPYRPNLLSTDVFSASISSGDVIFGKDVTSIGSERSPLRIFSRPVKISK
jgi:hypothetical protein